MASDDNFKVPTTQGCCGPNADRLNQGKEKSDLSVSKKNPMADLDANSSSEATSEDEAKNTTATKEDTWKGAEENDRLNKAITGNYVKPTQAFNPEPPAPNNEKKEDKTNVPPTQGCVPPTN
ncbi:MAG: hypothetical protein IKC23_08340 [Fibrobacter sp.]|nr:hypothetical protein [Fibrobacter sp.]